MEEEDQVVRVLWRDAYFTFDGASPDYDDYLVTTIGFLAGVDERFIYVASERLPADDGYRATTHVPIAVVERIDLMEVV